MSEEDASSKQKPDWLQYVGTTSVGFMVAYFGFAGTKDTNLTEALRIEKESVRTLRVELREANETIFIKNSEIVRVLAMLNTKVSDTQTLEQFLDSLPFPAWIKIKDESGSEEFRMLMVNTAYEQYYKIRKDRYHGKTDFDVHPYDVASMFKKHDELVFASKDYVGVNETVIVKDEVINLMVWKFSIKMADGRFGVAGFSWRKPTVMCVK